MRLPHDYFDEDSKWQKDVRRKEAIEADHEFEAFLAGLGDDDDELIDFLIDYRLKKNQQIAEDRELRKQERLAREKREALIASVKRKYGDFPNGTVYMVGVLETIAGISCSGIEVDKAKCIIYSQATDKTEDYIQTTVYYGDCTGISYKRYIDEDSKGYLQFHIPTNGSNINTYTGQNLSTFVYTQDLITNEEMEIIVEYINSRYDYYKEKQYQIQEE